MNIFEDCKFFTGTFDTTGFKQQYREFFSTALFIRGRLGERAHLLDEYLNIILKGYGAETAGSAGDAGYEATAITLIEICNDILNGSGSKKNHPFYQTAKNYIDRKPLPLNNRAMKTDIYMAALTVEFLDTALESFIKDIIDKISTDIGVDMAELNKLYGNICTMLGESDPMEKLNRLVSNCFIAASFTAIFVQGCITPAISSLGEYHAETNKTGLQHIMEMIELTE